MRFQEQFDKIFKKLVEMESHIGNMDHRLAGVDNRLAGVDNRLASVDNRLASLDERMSKAEGASDSLAARLFGFESYVLENMVTKKEATDTKAEIMSHIDLLAQRGSPHEDERLAGTVRIERLEDRVTRLEHRPSPS